MATQDHAGILAQLWLEAKNASRESIPLPVELILIVTFSIYILGPILLAQALLWIMQEIRNRASFPANKELHIAGKKLGEGGGTYCLESSIQNLYSVVAVTVMQVLLAFLALYFNQSPNKFPRLLFPLYLTLRECKTWVYPWDIFILVLMHYL